MVGSGFCQSELANFPGGMRWKESMNQGETVSDDRTRVNIRVQGRRNEEVQTMEEKLNRLLLSSIWVFTYILYILVDIPIAISPPFQYFVFH